MTLAVGMLFAFFSLVITFELGNKGSLDRFRVVIFSAFTVLFVVVTFKFGVFINPFFQR